MSCSASPILLSNRPSSSISVNTEGGNNTIAIFQTIALSIRIKHGISEKKLCNSSVGPGEMEGGNNTMFIASVVLA